MEKYDMGKTDTGKDDRTPLMVVDLDGTLVSVNTFTLLRNGWHNISIMIMDSFLSWDCVVMYCLGNAVLSHILK